MSDLGLPGKRKKLPGPTPDRCALNVSQNATVVRAAHAMAASARYRLWEIQMRNLGLAAIAAALLVGSAVAVNAQNPYHPNAGPHPRVTRHEAHELRSDRRDIHRDTRDLRGDNNEIRQDRRELRQDTREIRHDDTRAERREDLRDRRQDQRDLRRDLRDRRGDRLDRRQDVGDLRHDRHAARTN